MPASSSLDIQIAPLRAWAARGDDLLLIVILDGYGIALFKPDIDGADDEQLRQLLLDRLAARPHPLSSHQEPV